MLSLTWFSLRYYAEFRHLLWWNDESGRSFVRCSNDGRRWAWTHIEWARHVEKDVPGEHGMQRLTLFLSPDILLCKWLLAALFFYHVLHAGAAELSQQWPSSRSSWEMRSVSYFLTFFAVVLILPSVVRSLVLLWLATIPSAVWFCALVVWFCALVPRAFPRFFCLMSRKNTSVVRKKEVA